MVNISKITVLAFIVLFSFISCTKDDEIANDIYRSWEIVDFMSIESVAYPKNNNYNPVIQFHDDGKFTLQLDINSCFGSFNLLLGNNIEISEVGCTLVCCDSDYSEKVITMLPQVTSYSINANQLKLNVPGWGWINLELHN